MTERATESAGAGEKPKAPEIRCTCGETFDALKELQEHAQRYHKK